MAAVRGVLFDVDDTLFDYSGSDEAGLLAHLGAEGLHDRMPGPAALALWREITRAEYARYTAGETTFAAHRCARVRRFLTRLGQPGAQDMPDREAGAWFAGYTAHRDAARRALEGASAVLTEFAPRYRLGVVSNSSLPHQRGKLAAIGLLDYFGDALVCSEEHGEAKPAPGIFLAGCALLGLEPHEVAYVGNDHAVDAVGARDAGLHAYWLDRGETGWGGTREGAPAEGVRVIRSLAELPAALAAPAAPAG
ncbi:HAD family hydrolase [Streptomyces radiopugnans]|uniref:Putative hydrolase of the HAD superfamily n=1 Tax=Streptomyces radiopugnans TaxID=403935 RepID=A0A1H8ZHG0_9ACTN|nr:HAD family hydrolase [Streptomyces radiopugnans]SEP63791.1 putative hydrolase of the HAD superfamily [Streptomyces radiopugnans]